MKLSHLLLLGFIMIFALAACGGVSTPVATEEATVEAAPLTEWEIIEPVEVNRCDKFTLAQPACVDLGCAAAPQWASFRVLVG